MSRISTIATAGLFVVSSAAFAQTTSVPASTNPSVGGQASTQTPAGVPNPTQRPQGAAMGNSREAVRSEARVETKNPSNSMVPKGEPSTMTNNQPNAAQPTGAMTRAEVRPTGNDLKPQLGQKGERPDVPTNPADKTGTPK